MALGWECGSVAEDLPHMGNVDIQQNTANLCPIKEKKIGLERELGN